MAQPGPYLTTVGQLVIWQVTVRSQALQVSETRLPSGQTHMPKWHCIIVPVHGGSHNVSAVGCLKSQVCSLEPVVHLRKTDQLYTSASGET